MASYIGKTDQPAATQTDSGADIMVKMTDYLQNSQGLFIGESHDQNIARDFLLSHLNALKDAGVTTIYFEMQHPRIQGIREHGLNCMAAFNVGYATIQDPEQQKALENYVNKQGVTTLPVTLTEFAQNHNNLRFLDTLITEANKHGIAVVGHDITTAKSDTDSVDFAARINTRDKASARIIEQTKPADSKEKYLVFGGNEHARKSRSASDEHGNTIALEDGLSAQLRIPALTFRESSDINIDDPDTRARFEATIRDRGYLFVNTGDATTTVVAHRDGFSLSTSPTYPRTEKANIDVGYTLPLELFKDPHCRPSASDDHALLSPPQVSEIIRSINTERGAKR